jgi:hypothetical protein
MEREGLLSHADASSKADGLGGFKRSEGVFFVRFLTKNEND